MPKLKTPNWDGNGNPPDWQPNTSYARHSIVSHGGKFWVLACTGDDHNSGHMIPGTHNPEHHATDNADLYTDKNS